MVRHCHMQSPENRKPVLSGASSVLSNYERYSLVFCLIPSAISIDVECGKTSIGVKSSIAFDKRKRGRAKRLGRPRANHGV